MISVPNLQTVIRSSSYVNCKFFIPILLLFKFVIILLINKGSLVLLFFKYVSIKFVA